MGDAIQLARYLPMRRRARRDCHSRRSGRRCSRCCRGLPASRSALPIIRPSAAAVRHFLPDAAACRWPSKPGLRPFPPKYPICRFPRLTPCRVWDERLPSARPAAGRPRLVGQSKSRQGHQALDSASHARSHARRRRHLRQPAEGTAAGLDKSVLDASRHRRSHRRSQGFQRHRRAAVLPRSGDHGRHQRRPSRRRARAACLGAAAVFAGLSLAARPRRQPVVSDAHAFSGRPRAANIAACWIACARSWSRCRSSKAS